MASFNEAFAAARKKLGPGKTFTWNGKEYSTARADDKPARKEASTSTAPPKVDSTPPAAGKNDTVGRSLKITVKGESSTDAFLRDEQRLIDEENRKKQRKNRLRGDFGKNIYTSANKA